MIPSHSSELHSPIFTMMNPPIQAPAIVNVIPRALVTIPISAGENPLSTQKGFDMGTSAASPTR